MPNYKIHLIFGLIFSFIAFALGYYFNILQLDLKTIIMLIPFILLYSIIADLDIKTSKVSYLISFIFIGFMIYFFYFGMKIEGIITAGIFALTFIAQHRGFIHSIFSAVLFSILLLPIGWIYALFGFLSYISHLLIDREIKLW